MDVIYEKAAHFDEEMKSGLMKEKFSEVHIMGNDLERLRVTLMQNFKTNSNTEKQSLADLDLFIWPSEDIGDLEAFQITLNDHYSFAKNQAVVEHILEMMRNYPEYVHSIRIFRNCELDLARVEELLVTLNNGDVFENILENISKLCFIDSGTYLSKNHITQMIDKMERILFEGIVNRKIRVNGKEGVLKEVNGDYARFGFFERGVRKNYVSLSLVQKMGARTIRKLDVL